MAEIQMKVSVEQCLHYAFKEIAKQILDEHGVVILNANFNWTEVIGGYMLNDVTLETRTM
jgi:hypothetical protein